MLIVKNSIIRLALGASFLAPVTLVWAQASSSLQGTLPPAPLPESQLTLPASPAAARAAPSSGGATVRIQKIEISGNSAVSSEVLLKAVGEFQGKDFDLAGLNGLTEKVQGLLRTMGYPFSEVYLPPQQLNTGVLRMMVLEGRYGRVRASGQPGLVAGAQPFLDYGLKQGDLIFSPQLERTLLILDDQPGMRIRPVISPGTVQSQGDLTVEVERGRSYSGDVSVDNVGARPTGKHRMRGTLFANSPFRYGDRLAFNGLITDEEQWLGSVDYETPLGAGGWRGLVGFARTNYQLGAQFAALNAVGSADIYTMRVSYPWVRSQASNLVFSTTFQHKRLEDDFRATATVRSKRSDLLTAGLQFDLRDAILNGGITYGSLTLTSGNIGLDAQSEAIDAVTARTSGAFVKANLDIARIQRLSGPLSLYARYSGQWASQNLDASEKFNLGGHYGVRAYPLGEGVGDSGWLAQLELRYALGTVTPFLFVDGGRTRANTTPWDAPSAVVRKIGAAGVGMRAVVNQWNLDVNVGWRTQGGPSTSDSRDLNPRLYFVLGRRF